MVMEPLPCRSGRCLVGKDWRVLRPALMQFPALKLQRGNEHEVGSRGDPHLAADALCSICLVSVLQHSRSCGGRSIKNSWRIGLFTTVLKSLLRESLK